MLTLIDGLRFGGAEALLSTLAVHAPAHGLDLTVASLAPPERGSGSGDLMRSRLLGLGVEVLDLRIGALADPRAVPRVRGVIERSGCDIVHSHLQYSNIIGPVAARWAGRPCVCSVHVEPVGRSAPARERLKERLSLATSGRAAATIFVSRAARRSYEERWPGAQRNWMVLPNGVDLEEFQPAGPLAEDLRDGGPTVMVVGAFREGKGQDRALETWARVAPAHPAARLVLVGAGPREDALRALVASLGLEGRVVFAGSREDVPEVLRCSSIVLSMSEGEALPTVLMEAAACGRPVVATRVGGTAEVVVDGETGVLVDPGDVGAAAEALDGLLADPARAGSWGSAARSRAEAHFGADRWVGRLRALYGGICGPLPPTEDRP